MVLIVALIMLIVVTLLGLSVARMAAFEERITANLFDRSLAFQAAEAALRIGEDRAQAESDAGNSGFHGGGAVNPEESSCSASPCVDGLCSQPVRGCPARWLDSAFSDWKGMGSALDLGGLVVEPQYIVEFLGGGFPCDVGDPDAGALTCKRYRVTARSDGGALGRATVILQTIYATE